MLSHLKQRDLLKGAQVDVHSDGNFHHLRHLVQQLRLIWREDMEEDISTKAFS